MTYLPISLPKHMQPRLPEDVRRIVRLLGYRPRPGIAATGVVAAIAASPRPFELSAGFAIQGATGPGKPPPKV